MERCKSYLFGLIFICPFKVEVENCSFTILRKMEIKNRIAFIETLSSKEREKLLLLHQSCLINREKEIFINCFEIKN